MRKDYVSVDSATGALDEAAFVEHYWTAQWRDRSSPPDASAVTRREEYPFMHSVLSQLSQGSRILDGGCGMGEWTVFLAQQGFDVTGLDISEATIARLGTWFPTSTFLRGDLRRTDFPDSSFDAYLLVGHVRAFREWTGRLSRGGEPHRPDRRLVVRERTLSQLASRATRCAPAGAVGPRFRASVGVPGAAALLSMAADETGATTRAGVARVQGVQRDAHRQADRGRADAAVGRSVPE